MDVVNKWRSTTTPDIRLITCLYLSRCYNAIPAQSAKAVSPQTHTVYTSLHSDSEQMNFSRDGRTDGAGGDAWGRVRGWGCGMQVE